MNTDNTDNTGSDSTTKAHEKINRHRDSHPKECRGSVDPGVQEFAKVINDYREALAALGALPTGGALHAQAVAVEEALRDRCFKVTVACLLCTSPVDHEFTVAEFAALRGAPRGICGAHGLDDAGSGVEVLLA